MKKIILTLTVLSVNIAFAQTGRVGINTADPKSTLHIAGSPTEATKLDGIIAPKLTGAQLRTKMYTSDQTGALVYVTVGDTSPSGQTANVTSAGYYYFNGSVWIKLVSATGVTSITADNGLNMSSANNVQLGGELNKNTLVSGLTNTNKLSFTATGIDAFNIDNSTLSVDAGNNRIGIGTAAPLQTLDVQGTFRLSQTNAANMPNVIPSEYKTLLVNPNTGQVVYGTNSTSRFSGGYRPGTSYVVAKIANDNTIARFRFVCYPDQSNALNNGTAAAYTYGDFTIVGMVAPTSNIAFAEKNIKGFDGTAKTLITNTATQITWSNGGLGDTTISINQTTGEITISNANNIFTSVFEMIGGS